MFLNTEAFDSISLRWKVRMLNESTKCLIA